MDEGQFVVAAPRYAGGHDVATGAQIDHGPVERLQPAMPAVLTEITTLPVGDRGLVHSKRRGLYLVEGVPLVKQPRTALHQLPSTLEERAEDFVRKQWGLVANGLSPQPTSRAELTAFMKKEDVKWGAIVRERKITAN